MSGLRVLGLVPARGGSRGVPGKNIRELCGKPLLQYTVEAALQARRLNRLVLTTDDERIAAVGRTCGIDVPFLRPAHLATDAAPTLPVIQHAVAWLEAQGDWFDAVCLLQPTNPLRRAADIDGCIELLERAHADAVVTVLPVPHEYNPHWVYFASADGTLALSTGELVPIPRRQELPAAFHREGSVYVTRRDVVMEQGSLYGSRLLGYPLEPERCVGIDTTADWRRAEALIGTRA